MARIFMTGAEDGTTNAFSSVAGSPTASTTQKRTGAYALYTPDRNAKCYFNFTASVTELYVRFAVWMEIWQSSGPTQLLTLRDASGNTQNMVTIAQATRRLEVRRGTTVIATGTTTIALQTWYVVEARFLVHDSTGRVELRVNGGANEVDFTGDTAQTGTVNYGSLASGYTWDDGGYPTDVKFYIDDLAVNSTAGDRNNSWVGQGGIRLVYPDGNTSDIDWTASAGANYDAVNNRPPSAAYVYSNTMGAEDIYTLDTSALPAAGTVSAVKALLYAKVDADGGKVAGVMRLPSDGTDTLTARTLSTSYLTYGEILEVDPIHDETWTLARLGLLELGARIVS